MSFLTSTLLFLSSIPMAVSERVGVPMHSGQLGSNLDMYQINKALRNNKELYSLYKVQISFNKAFLKYVKIA